jgi:hypothetical protein
MVVIVELSDEMIEVIEMQEIIAMLIRARHTHRASGCRDA